MKMKKKSISVIVIVSLFAVGCSAAVILTASASTSDYHNPPNYYLGSNPEEEKKYNETKEVVHYTDEYQLMETKVAKYTEEFNETFSRLKEERALNDTDKDVELIIDRSDASDVILDEMKQESLEILQKYGCIDQDVTLDDYNYRLEEFIEVACNAVVDAPDANVVMGVQAAKAHDEIGLVGVEVFSNDLLVRREVLRVKIAKFLIARILDGLLIPFSTVAGARTKDDARTGIREFRVAGNDRSIVLADVDHREMPQRTNPRILHAGTGQDVGMELVAELIDPPGLLQESQHDPDLGILPPLFEDVMVRNSCILEQIL